MGALAKRWIPLSVKTLAAPVVSVIIHGSISSPYFQKFPPVQLVCVCWGQIVPADICVERDLFIFLLLQMHIYCFTGCSVQIYDLSRFIPSCARVQTCTGREDGIDFFVLSARHVRPWRRVCLPWSLSLSLFFNVCMTTHAHPFSYNPVKAAPPQPSSSASIR